ncbi:hypothetical protein O9G_001649 [Rozella allomycis CSF55]|uniref:Uncharacterized protein n=1 Tax=Rozella allomycis (strain CSF55) TaxID=988480 RepID=A0A075AXP4_ROZAC|nr:hypothetical protein O9G_001649 [Rozella allomycis CSF55]|eukprot:EPZ34919.1 hypothetical protein O9G_001649 [Rozella allomycis CSF55]
MPFSVLYEEEHTTITPISCPHITGSLMFLIQGCGPTVLFTGDVRLEKDYVEKLLIDYQASLLSMTSHGLSSGRKLGFPLTWDSSQVPGSSSHMVKIGFGDSGDRLYQMQIIR